MTAGTRATPSISCEPCRLKRRRCDLKKPECSQCQRKQVKCHGYRDAFTLKLRDETNATAVKVQHKKARGKFIEEDPSKAIASDQYLDMMLSAGNTTEAVDLSFHFNYDSSSEFSFGSILPNPAKTSPIPSVPPSLMSTPVAAEVAANYFLTVFAPQTAYHWLPTLFVSPQSALTQASLNNAMTAPALAILSQTLNLPPLLDQAYTYYAKALSSTQSALSNPSLATENTTLASIMLLGLFELLVFRGRKSPAEFDKHARGGAMLLELRGDAQFEDELSRKIYMHASGHVRRECSLRGLKFSKGLARLHDRALKLAEAGHFGDELELLSLRIGNMVLRLGKLRTDTRKLGLRPKEWVERAVRIGVELDEMAEILGRHLPFEVVRVDDMGAKGTKREIVAFEQTFHVYPSTNAMRKWNDFRVLRLFACEFIRDGLNACLADPAGVYISPTEDSRLQALAKLAAKKVSFDTLYSVPYVLDMSDTPQISSPSLVLVLASIAIATIVPVHARVYATERLEYIGTHLHVRQAEAAFNMVCEKTNLEAWTTILH